MSAEEEQGLDETENEDDTDDDTPRMSLEEMDEAAEQEVMWLEDQNARAPQSPIPVYESSPEF